MLAAEGLGKHYSTGPARIRPLLRALWGSQASPQIDGGLWAVRDVSLALARGDSLGIIGRNGSGKTTLLRLLARTALPTAGRVESRARVACILDLGVGFNRLETGRDNAERTLVLQAGLTRREARRRIGEVEAFAEIGEFFDRPIRTYSDGMRLRLAFAAITRLDPEVLITDEVLAVGDEAFQQKCNQWFDRFVGRGGTLVLCSHDLFQIQRLCPRALWLDSGRVVQTGETREVIRAYRASLGVEAEGEEAEGRKHVSGERTGLAYEVVSLRLQDESGQEVRALPPDSTVLVTADVHAEVGVPQVHIGITRADLTPVYGVSSDMEGAVPEDLGHGRYRYQIRFFRLPLTAGQHRLRAHALDETGTRLYDTVEIEFSVLGDDEDRGLVRLDWQWDEEGEG